MKDGKNSMAETYKNPLAQADAISKIPEFNKEAIVRYLKNYGSGFDDDNYEAWAKQKGKPLQGKPLNPEFLKTSFAKQWYGDRTETYADQYLNDDEWLQEVWPDVAEDALEYNRQFAPKDADEERAWGPSHENEDLEELYKYKLGGE